MNSQLSTTCEPPRIPRMKVLVVSTYFSPDVCGIAPVVADLCDGLVDRGHEVAVLTSFPHYPEWKNKSDAWPWSRKTEQLPNGMQIVRHGAWVPSRPSGIVSRLLYESSMMFSLFRSLLFRRSQFDVIYAVCPSAGNLVYARLRTWITGEPVVINVQDIPAEAAGASGLAGGFVKKIAMGVQKWLFRGGQSLTTISQPMVDCIQDSVGQAAKLTPNWLVGEIADAVADSGAELDQEQLSKSASVVDLLYSGNIGNKQGLMDFCVYLRKSDLPFQFSINGCGSAYENLQEQLTQHPDDRILPGPLLDSGPFVERLKRATWFVITEKSGMGAAVMPSKLIPAVSFGIPILAVCDEDGALGRVVTGEKIGVRLGWDSLDDLQQRVLSVSPEQRSAMKENCLRVAKTYDRRIGLSSVEQIIFNAVKASGDGVST